MKLHKPLIGGRNLQLWKLEHSVQCTVWCTVYSLHFLWRGSCAVCTKAAIWIPGEKLKHKSPTTLHPVVNSEKAHTTQEFTAQCNAKQSSLRIALQNAKDRNHKTLELACKWQLHVLLNPLHFKALDFYMWDSHSRSTSEFDHQSPVSPMRSIRGKKFLLASFLQCSNALVHIRGCKGMCRFCTSGAFSTDCHSILHLCAKFSLQCCVQTFLGNIVCNCSLQCNEQNYLCNIVCKCSVYPL